jgi:hypothetical protein
MVRPFGTEVNEEVIVIPGDAPRNDERESRCHPRGVTDGKAAGGAFGLACSAEYLAFQAVETVRRRKELITVGIAHHDTNGLRTYLNHVTVGHCQPRLESAPTTGSLAVCSSLTSQAANCRGSCRDRRAVALDLLGMALIVDRDVGEIAIGHQDRLHLLAARYPGLKVNCN